VIVALWLLETVVVVAMNVAVVADAATVTEDGTVRVVFVLLNVTTAPPVGAALVSVTVQVELPELLKVAGEQAKEETPVEVVAPVTVPLATETAIDLPPLADAALLVMLIAVLVAPDATVRFAVATVPFAIMAAFKPEATQLYLPVPAKHTNVLPAAVRAAPPLTEIEVTLAEG